MGTRVFAERGGFKLHGDDRDIAVNWQQRHEVLNWCLDNSIDANYNGFGTVSGKFFGVDLWRIEDEQQRMLFLLKWGTGDSF